MKLNRSVLVILFALSLLSSAVLGQDQKKYDSVDDLVQLSGVVIDTDDGKAFPIPFANVAIKNSYRGVYADGNGFFSIVAVKGETVVFSALGYHEAEFVISDTLSTNRYSMVQILSRDTLNLPEVIIYPWPSRKHFRLEFLAMEVSDDLALQERALDNLSRETMAELREELIADGAENANFYLREQAKTYYYAGQTPPQRIFDPVAWSKFIKSLQKGEVFGKKKK